MAIEELDPLEAPEPPVGSPAVRVSAILPAGYPVYLRLFHPFVDWDAPRDKPPVHRATWKELAERVGVPYGPQLTARQLNDVIGPTSDTQFALWHGELTPGVVVALSRALRAEIGEEPVFFAYGLGAVIAGIGPARFHAPLSEFETIRRLVADRNAGIAVHGPETIWPADRRWVIHTDYDLTSTYVACAETTANHLEREADLELQRVALTDRIDDRADERA